MSKGSLFTGQPILSQVLSLVPKDLFDKLAQEHKADRYYKNFFAFDHLVTMLAGTFMGCTSLMELVTGMQASFKRLSHCGLKNTPRKSTLADANKNRSEAFFGALFHALYKHYYTLSPDSSPVKWLLKRLFILDSTTISLFSDVLHGTGSYGLNGRKKGGAKAHVVVRAKDDVPVFIDLTEGKRHDQHMLGRFSMPKGSVIVLDMGYNNYDQWNTWQKEEVWWVTRMKGGTVVKASKNLPVTDKHAKAGVLTDQLVRLGSNKKNVQARLVRYRDPESERVFEFITNNLKWAPTTIAQIYRQRWQIEILFKRLKQNFPLRSFLGESANAIKIQIWCAFIADLLLKVVADRVRREGGRPWSFSNLTSVVRIHLHNYIDLVAFLKDPHRALLSGEPPKVHWQQLKLSF
jgi:hypothetical protein